MRSRDFGDIVGAFLIQSSRFKPHLPVPLKWLVLIWMSVICLHVVDAATGLNPSAYSRWTRALRVDSNSPQTVGLLLSIREKLYEMGEKQKQDVTPSRVFNDLDVISHRLQNIEEQISRAESYNKMRLEQLIESSMKSELLIDQLARRVEKNYQHITNRLSDMDKTLEKATKSQQETMEKIVRKIESQQGSVTNGRFTGPIHSSITPTRMNIQPQHIFNNNAERESTAGGGSEVSFNGVDDDRIDGSGSTTNYTSLPRNISFANQFALLQKFVKNESNRIVSVMDEKQSRFELQAAFLNNSLDECVSLVNKIYAKLGDQSFDETNYFDNFLKPLIAQINAQNNRNVDKLEMLMKNSIDVVLRQQQAFSNNCYRLQSDEEQMEDKFVAILETLIDYIDNQTDRVQRNCQIHIGSQQARDYDRNDPDRELIVQNSSRTSTASQPEPKQTDQLQKNKNISNTPVIPSTSNSQILSPDSNATSTNISVLRSDTEITLNTKTTFSHNLTQLDAGDDTVPHDKITADTADENSQHHHSDAGANKSSKTAALRSRLWAGARVKGAELQITETGDEDWTEESPLSSDIEYDDAIFASDHSDEIV